MASNALPAQQSINLMNSLAKRDLVFADELRMSILNSILGKKSLTSIISLGKR